MTPFSGCLAGLLASHVIGHWSSVIDWKYTVREWYRVESERVNPHFLPWRRTGGSSQSRVGAPSYRVDRWCDWKWLGLGITQERGSWKDSMIVDSTMSFWSSFFVPTCFGVYLCQTVADSAAAVRWLGDIDN